MTTTHIQLLDKRTIKEIKQLLKNKGFSHEDIENALNGRLSDLEDTININDLKTLKKDDDKMKIKHIKKTYQPTSSGKNWSQAKKNIDIEKRYITLEFYKKYTSKENIQFFNDRVERSYRKIGYVPTKLTRYNHDRTQKIVDTFIFENEFD